MSNETLKDFCEMYRLKNLITEPTCYKNPNNPSSIDVILTNRVNSFYNSTVIDVNGTKGMRPKERTSYSKLPNLQEVR